MRLSALVTAAVLAALPALAGEIAPAIVYSIGDKFDGSFNEAAYRGAESFKRATGIAYREVTISNEAQLEQAQRRFAQRGQDPIVGVGFFQTAAVTTVAKEFPKTRFTVIDTAIDLPNVQSVLFREHEGSFLVGMLAAMASRTGTIGMVGGMDIPLVRRFFCGYEQGAKYVNPAIAVIYNSTGNTPAAWTDPGRAAELAKSQFERGVDVVFAAAGTSGLGAMQAAKDRGKLTIGVDSNQNHLFPGTVLTSMVKRVDLAVEESFAAARDGRWRPGLRVIGLKEGGVDWALDEHNAKLISADMKAKVEWAKVDIIAGKIKVHDYMSNNSCTP
ncbi:MAG: BMP family ABC transporter substrate-binding protein [Rhodospirillales bacterium]|nr:BMP family ABC transporter substrate-binding protein [Rhodospirillales bacterium]